MKCRQAFFFSLWTFLVTASVGLFGLPVAPVYAIEGFFKVSESFGGVQIWFEAEAFDQRCPAPMEIDDPDLHPYFPVVEMEGAFEEGELGDVGLAVNRISGEGMLRYTFDIAAADGEAGTWYFWGRITNPSNNSDYLLVEGDPEDPVIPQGDCEIGGFPGGNEATFPGGAFVNADDRIFEVNAGDPGPPPVWAWAQPNHEEGHTKELQDGENSMYLFRREGNQALVFWDVFMWTNDADYVPTDDDYLDAEEIEVDTECPPDGDTHCRGITVEGPDGNVEGIYRVTVDAVDDGGDDIRYVLIADNGVEAPRTLTQVGDNVLEIVLTEGTWALRVTVDDSISCEDAAEDDTCTHDPIEVAAGPLSDYRVSNVDGGVQIWIQAEDFDARFDDLGPDPDPPIEPHPAFPVVVAEGALGDPEGNAINRAGANGMLVYHFDITEAGGFAGTWYFWGRVINPNNNSDFMLVDGDPLDDIPGGPPFPGGNVDPFDIDDDRVFEGDVGSPGPPPLWGWHGNEEGHIKELRDGQNSMHMFRREGNPAAFWDLFVWADNPDYRPSIDDYILAEPRNRPPCDDEADTHCVDFTVTGPPDESEGVYTVTVEADDEGGDTIYYTVTVDDGFGTIRHITRNENTIPIYLTPGVWTLTVRVDDDKICDDEANDATCAGEEFLEVLEREKLGDFKVSEFGDGVQIWFEAEDYTERFDDIGPDLDPPVEPHAYFPVVDKFGANFQAIERDGGAGGGMIYYEFDLDRTDDGFGGTWYFWGRVINPGNRSDYLLVDGDPDDPVIPDGPPFPGGNEATFADPDGGPDSGFINSDDRIFEENIGGDALGGWAWARQGSPEGHTKELRDGVNEMFIFPRESGNGTVFWDTFMWTNDPIYVPTDEDYLAATPLSLDGENCTNDADDDGDGLVDCEDPDCRNQPACQGTAFVRGDANADGMANIADGVFILNFLFGGGAETPPCREATDTNDDDSVNIADGVYLLSFLFASGEAPPAPHPDCGRVDGLSAEDCMSFPACPQGG